MEADETSTVAGDSEKQTQMLASIEAGLAAGSAQNSGLLVQMTGITKRFGSFTANDSINLGVERGQIHALLGENGAGKSTLMKILNGLLRPDEGEIVWNGEAVQFESPQDAAKLGISMVFQHFSLFENMSVLDNIAVALPGSIRQNGFNLGRLSKRIEEVGEAYGLALSPHRPVYSLSAGERQRIEIIRALLRDPKLLVLDEPTSVLTPQEADALFVTLEQLAQKGCGLLYISHKLDEVQRLCSKATILRGGKLVGECDPRKEDVRSLAAMMVGSHIPEVRSPALHKIGDVRLEVEALTLPASDPHAKSLNHIMLSVHGGEVLGIAGIAGNGQSELFAALSGETLAPQARTILIDTMPVGQLDIESRRALGAAFIPEQRLGHGAVPGMALSDNLVLSRHGTDRLDRYGMVNFRRARRLSDDVISKFDVRISGKNPVASSLSGGNLQKFVVGREILARPGVLVVDQPTWGVDAGAAVAIRQALINLAAQGAAVLVISQDLDELFSISDRMAVLHEGSLSAALATGQVTRETIGLMMAGSEVDDAA